MSTNTLTSLAILKVNVDHGRDYLDYLKPFVLQVLIEHQPEVVTAEIVREHIQDQYGLVIPSRTIQILLRRLSRSTHLKRSHGVYQITGDLPDPRLITKQSAAERHIRSVLRDFQKFSIDTVRPIQNEMEAVTAVCTFLAEFDVACLRAYLQGTAIPHSKETRRTDVVLVSDYIRHIQENSPARFDSFLILVQGHMLANALLCPDLQLALKTYRGVTFYLDTPLLVQRLGLEGEAKQIAIQELISLIVRLGGRVAAFSHSRDELDRVLRGAASNISSSNSRGQIILEARRRGTTRSDLLLLAEAVGDELHEMNIALEATPRYIERFQIDETVFENVLEDEVSYLNPRAKEYDINSVRSIYVIRANKPAPSLEKSRAILVTSNTAFAKAAWEYGQKYETSKEVSSVISDFTLANMAWLKAPMKALDIPTTQLLAFSYAALEPSPRLLEKYLAEIDKLEDEGRITERDHQLLRSSSRVYGELMNLTLGEDDYLTTQTVIETLRRVSDEIKKEELGKLSVEQEAHKETLNSLRVERSRNREVIVRLHQRCEVKAKRFAFVFLVCVIALLAAGMLSGLRMPSPLSWIITGGSIILGLVTLINLVAGSTVRMSQAWMERRLLKWLLEREAKRIGVNLREFDIG